MSSTKEPVFLNSHTLLTIFENRLDFAFTNNIFIKSTIMRRIHTGAFVPKYENGKWTWKEQDERIAFESFANTRSVKEDYIKTNGFKFGTNFNQIEELIFHHEFERTSLSKLTHDADVILIQDIKNVVLFLAPSEMITKDFIHFVHTVTVDRFLHSLIIYFEYYLRMVEFVLIRRDEITGEKALINSQDSTEIKRIFSAHLSQYRLLLARDYKPMILGNGDMKNFYHIKPVVNISQTIKDKRFHEIFLAFSTQCVWIAMHRRGYSVIDAEMNRLFRSEHFKLRRDDQLKFSKIEAEMLYGRNYRRVNYRAQNSPLIQELANVTVDNMPILSIGELKYRGSDYRIMQLELEYLVPDSQLALIDVTHGILGHPKIIYDTLLRLDWEAVRFEHYSEDFDPYRIVRQPCLEIPIIDAEKLRKYAKQYDTYYCIQNLHEKATMSMLRKWCERDKFVNYFKEKGMATLVLTKCEKEMQDKSYGKTVQQIIAWYILARRKLKKRHES